jgi:hypothetical protein
VFAFHHHLLFQKYEEIAHQRYFWLSAIYERKIKNHNKSKKNEKNNVLIRETQKKERKKQKS